VVAEGVETHEQFELLSKSAVDEIQGYLIGKPVAPEALEKLILIPDKRLPLQKKSADAILTFADDNDPVIVYKAAVVE
jgi:predicted signal transduction protein with EAL and GGDEF domain